MRQLADELHRKRALTDLGATLLVEAAAGTGKTSLLAGRVVVLLANAVPPREIAAITFTEFAAGELRERVTQYLADLLAGHVPRELRLAFGTEPPEAQRMILQTARTHLDELTCTTIHGFCYDLLRTYSVEAAIDPGAEILDSVQADLAFRSIFEQWLRRRLDSAQPAADPIALIAQIDPIGAEKLLRTFAECRRAHRTARPPTSDLDRHAEVDFIDSVTEFRRWFNGTPGPREAAQDVIALEQLAEHFRGKFNPPPGFDRLWSLAHPPHVPIMRKRGLDLLRYQRRVVWQKAAVGNEGKRLADQAADHYEACAQAFRALIGRLATAIVSTFSSELDGLLADFETFKRSAAVLDFDDLLYTTRHVLQHNDSVRAAAAQRFQRILVDEFQDTDPIQAEIVFLLTSVAGPAESWHQRRLVPGRLFMVGDPKQAIYRFRGADIATYLQARNAVEEQFPGNIIHVSSNFRSCDAILHHVNLCFEAPLGTQETGYVPLEPTRGKPEHGLPCVAKVKVDVIPQSRVDGIRDDEATIVAETCARLIGNLKIRRGDAPPRRLEAGDIALLAPIGTELWRYERALEEVGLPFSSQAGKNLFRRQEVQDLVALVRALADARDTLALGALMRGPLVGLTEQELLDLTGGLPEQADAGQLAPRLTLTTDPSAIAHPVARETLTVLRDLRRRVASTAPSVLIAEAIERLKTRAILMARSSDQAARALANIDALVERARAYGVRGFREFARDLDADWARRTSHTEGVVDAEGQSIEIVTIHSSKGLEWPVVIPINMASRPRSQESFVHRRQDDSLHWMLGDIVPPSLAGAMQSETQEEAQQRLRLLYVACTRAMDMLVLPELSWSDTATWARAVDFRLNDVPALDIAAFRRQPIAKAPETPNTQTAAIFATERSGLDAAFAPITWVRPSQDDQDILQVETSSVVAWEQPIDAFVVVKGGSVRGTILHKLMEELITAELLPAPEAARERASVLIRQLVPTGPPPGLDAQEMAQTALRTFSLPELSMDHENLVAEVPVYGRVGISSTQLVSGRADAVRYREQRAQIVFDWKSDVAPDGTDRAAYAKQLSIYVDLLNAQRGAIVYMSTGLIEWVSPSSADA
jgi:CRISPR-associated exonuclease Cas4